MARPDRAFRFPDELSFNPRKRKARHEINRFASRRRINCAWPGYPAQGSKLAEARYHAIIGRPQIVSIDRIDNGSEDFEIIHVAVIHCHDLITFPSFLGRDRFSRSGQRAD